MAALAKITIPIDLALSGGKYNSFVLDSVVRGFIPKTNDTHVIMEADLSKKQPTFEELREMVLDQCKFENIKLGLKFDNTAAGQQLVPEDVRGATYTDDEGETINRNFLQWIKAAPGTQQLKQYEGAYYMKANWGQYLLNSDELKLIHAVTGVQVIEWTDHIANFSHEDATVIEL